MSYRGTLNGGLGSELRLRGFLRLDRCLNISTVTSYKRLADGQKVGSMACIFLPAMRIHVHEHRGWARYQRFGLTASIIRANAVSVPRVRSQVSHRLMSNAKNDALTGEVCILIYGRMSASK